MTSQKTLALIGIILITSCGKSNKIVHSSDPVTIAFKDMIAGKTFVTASASKIAVPIFRGTHTTSFKSGKEFIVDEHGDIVLKDPSYFTRFSKVNEISYTLLQGIDEESALYDVRYSKDGSFYEATDIGNKTIVVKKNAGGIVMILLKGSDGVHKDFATELLPDGIVTEALDTTPVS
ncbi:MAG: hypothetical protein ACRCTJ_03030 [Brevinema sp.]